MIFQEGKCIEGEFYIVAVYDDPASCTISFSAYELENDCTYTYPLTYSEFDALFKYDSELMNPSNQDGRFHWVIERMDFVQDSHGAKVLCLAQEPTPQDDDEDDTLAEQKPKSSSIAPAHAGGKVDAATKVKLLKELDTQDDHKLHVQLVKSENARKQFIAKLQSQRLLQVEKASQRLLKADEKREARILQLEAIKQEQAERAKQHKEKEKAVEGTQKQLELLMKQKEAQAIRKLIQEKDEQDRGMGKEKDVARQRRKMQERSTNEVKAIEAERAKQMGRKREDQVAKKELQIARKSRVIAEKVFQIKEHRREIEARRRHDKDKMIEEIWVRKSEERQSLDDKRNQFEAMEEVRDRNESNRFLRRAHAEREHWQAMRKKDAAEEEAMLQRRHHTRKEQLLSWSQDATHRAVARREIERRSAGREKKILAREELRLRRFRETQFLETRKTGFGASKTEGFGDTTIDAQMEIPEGSSPQEIEAFTKSFEEQERQRRRAERQEKRKLEEAKSAKMTQLVGPDPNLKELRRIAEWRAADEALRKKLEAAKTKRELEREAVNKAEMVKKQDRAELWAELEERRRAASRERSQKRIEAAVARTKSLPAALALPLALPPGPSWMPAH